MVDRYIVREHTNELPSTCEYMNCNYATNMIKRRVALLDGSHAAYLPCSSAMLVSWLDPSCAMEGQNLTHPSGDTAMQDGVTISEFPPDEKTFT